MTTPTTNTERMKKPIVKPELPRFEVTRSEENNSAWAPSLVIGTFGPFVVVDHGKYDNEQDEDFHKRQADAFVQIIRRNGGAA